MDKMFDAASKSPKTININLMLCSDCCGQRAWPFLSVFEAERVYFKSKRNCVTSDVAVHCIIENIVCYTEASAVNHARCRIHFRIKLHAMSICTGSHRQRQKTDGYTVTHMDKMKN